jgi:two-component system, cell cycle sensor histidine kinase and response regulator CckA
LDNEFIQIQGYCETGNYALISVTDTGCGMDKKTTQNIFEPYFTIKEVGKGTGPGLSTVYSIIKQHNGFINVDSEPDKGTVFKIYLPTVKTQSVETRQIPKEIQGGTETILVAEDNNELRDLTKKYLCTRDTTF